MRLLVTGVNGFLGRTFAEVAINHPMVDDVIGISRGRSLIDHYGYEHIQADINDISVINSIKNNTYIDTVVHFAANPAPSDTSSDVLNNIILTDHALRLAQGKKFVLASSATVLGVSPDGYSMASTTKPESLYAFSKLSSEQLVKHYYDTGKIPEYKIIRYVAHVGKYATHGAHVDIFNKLSEETDSITLKTNSTKPFLYAHQSMQRTLDYLIMYAGNSTIDLAPTDNLSIANMVTVMCDAMGRSIPAIKWTSSYQGDQFKLKISNPAFAGSMYSSKDAITMATKELLNV